MSLSRLALIVAVYLSLDVANPMMPGALVFGAEDSVELRQPDRSPTHEETPLAPAPERVVMGEPAIVSRRPTQVASSVTHTPVTRSHLARPASASPSAEDN